MSVSFRREKKSLYNGDTGKGQKSTVGRKKVKKAPLKGELADAARRLTER